MNAHIENIINKKSDQIIKKIYTNPNTFLVFGIESCKYCKNSIQILTEKNLPFKYYSLDKYYDFFLNILERITNLDIELNIDPNHKTFPIIFYNGKYVGGSDKLKKLI